MIGPVQFMMIGFSGTELPATVRQRLVELRGNQAMRLIDMLGLRKNRDGTLEHYPVAELIPEYAESGDLLARVLERASFRETMWGQSLAGPTPEGEGLLFAGNPVPDARQLLAPGHSALALLWEHQWAAALRDAVVETSAIPLGDAWLGTAIQQGVGLLPTGAGRPT